LVELKSDHKKGPTKSLFVGPTAILILEVNMKKH